MRSIRTTRPSPALVVAMVAMFAAVSGTAIAGQDAITKAVTKKSVKKTAKKVSNKQITKRAPGLAVLSAETAGSATTAEELTTQEKLGYQATAGSADVELFNDGQLRLVGRCAAGPAVELRAETLVSNATINSYGNGGDTTDDDWDTGDVKVLSSDDEERDVVYTAPDGSVITFQYGADEGALYGGAAACIVKGLLQSV